jgi:probable phosphoglycerate mutase
VRHGLFEGIEGRLAGRSPGVSLSVQGRNQARRVARRLSALAIDAIYSSPVQRATETATVIAEALGLPVQAEPAIEELDFGRWTGQTFDELSSDSDWRTYNQFRSAAPLAGGGFLLDVQARVIAWMAARARSAPETTLVAVSHADVIRCALAACAGISLDLALRLEIAPASISEIRIGEHQLLIRRINDRAHLEGEV